MTDIYSDRRKVLFLLVFLLTGIVLTVAPVAADSIFLARVGEQKVARLLPLIYIAVGLLSLTVVWLINLLRSKVNSLLLTTLSPLLDATFFVILFLLLDKAAPVWLLALVMVVAELSCFLSLMRAYALTGEYYSSRNARRTYPVIGLGIALGTVLAGLCVPYVAAYIGSDMLLALCALTQVGVVAVMRLCVSGPRPAMQVVVQSPSRAQRPGGLFFICLVLIIILGQILFRDTEYVLRLTAARSMNEYALTVFFSRFYTLAGMVQLPVQLLLVPLALRRVGPARSLFATPVTVLAAAGLFIMHPGLYTAGVLCLVPLVLSETLDIPSREMLVLIFPPEVRRRVQALLSGAVVPVGSALAGLLLLAGEYLEQGPLLFAFVLVPLSLLLVGVLLVLRLRYREALRRNLRRTSLNNERLRELLAFPESASVLDRELHTLDSGALQALALLLDDALRDQLAAAFRQLAKGEDVERAVIALQVLTVKPRAEDESLLRELMASEYEPLAAAAISGFAVLQGQAAVEELAVFLDDRSEHKAAAAMAGLMKYGGAQGAVLADVRLDSLLNDDNPWKRLFAFRVLGDTWGYGFVETAAGLLAVNDDALRRETVRYCARLRDAGLVPLLVPLLADSVLRRDVLATLRVMPPQSLATLRQAFVDNATPLETRRLLALAIAAAGGTAAFEVLWPVYVSSEDYLLRNGILQGLRSAGGATVTAVISRNIDRELRTVSRRLRKVVRLNNRCAPGDFLAMILSDRALMLCREIFSLLYVRDRNAEILRVEANLFSTDARCRDNALELLEQLLHGAVQKEVLRALDDWLAAAPAARVSTRATHNEIMACDPWLRTAAIYSLCQRGDINPEKDVDMNTHEQQLFDTVRTISFLKRIELFREIPAELLAGLADICHERMFADGAVIFGEADPGDSLYLIIDGKVSIRKNDVEFSLLEANDCLGEMALLDGNPRSASCVAVGSCRLLRIDAADFMVLLESYPEVSRSLLKTLTMRMRQLIERTVC